MVLMITLISLAGYSQVDTARLSSMDRTILKTFKDVYVVSNTDDVKSYKLVRYSAIPVTFGQFAKNQINLIKKSLSDYSNNDLKQYERWYANMDKSLRNSVKYYMVTIDCYIDDEPVTSRYTFNYGLHYNSVKDRIDYYKDNTLWVYKN